MVAKLARACTLRIRLRLLTPAPGPAPPPENFFSEFQMEGVSEDSNAIYVELAAENLSRAPKTAQNARALEVKLTNKHFPSCRCPVSVELARRFLAGVCRAVAACDPRHPVKVTPRKPWRNLQEPQSQTLMLLQEERGMCHKDPQSARRVAETRWRGSVRPGTAEALRVPAGWWPRAPVWVTEGRCHVGEHLSAGLEDDEERCGKNENISNQLIIEANLNGDLNLKIESELVCVTTHFKDLGNPPSASENESEDRSPEQMAEVQVDIRKFLQFLAGQQVNPTRGVCNIVSHKMVHFDLLHEDMSLQYFIPALS
ncbi:checkpoint protein HUS1-like [Myotis lucifugus]|uniref:checkpoint protein HUS1-like n=1 Tax=Myotis lucifugus TaxID=59463 RepID=UPI000CCC7BB7|nr:checkpoint protein HUS1-like [Myotis lucifugus]